MLRRHLPKRASVRTYTQQVRSISTQQEAHFKDQGQDAATDIAIKAKSPLHGTISIITGASRGIGRAIATSFAQKGSRCLLIGRDEAALKETETQCNEETRRLLSISESGDEANKLPHPMHTCQIGDIGSRDFWTSLDLKAHFPSPNSKENETSPPQPLILVNAAGITHSSLLLRTSAAQIEAVMQTNLMGTLWASQIVGKQMLRRKAGGVIVNVASLLAVHGGAGSAAYVASKAGVVGLTRSLAAELGPAGVRVNAVLPGYVESDMTRAMSPKAREEALSKIPAGRFGDADEVADAAVFLATNTYANNCIINLDGGLSAV